MKKSAIISLVAVVFGVVCSSPLSAQGGAGYKPIHHSLFLSSERDRNPFWPVGWVKQAPVSATPIAGPVESAVLRTEDYALTAILLGRPALAVINGREYAEGDFIILRPGAPKSKVQVFEVRDGQVTLRFMSKDYTIFLKRKGEEKMKKEGIIPQETPLPPSMPALE